LVVGQFEISKNGVAGKLPEGVKEEAAARSPPLQTPATR